MQNGDYTNLLLSRVQYPESLKLQLAVFETHLTELRRVMEVLSECSPTELDSYKLIEQLVTSRIEQLKTRLAGF